MTYLLMAAAGTQISVQEYLHTVYPDCDYVDGVLEDRNVGEWDHSTVQTRLVVFFSKFENVGSLARTELRMRVRDGSFERRHSLANQRARSGLSQLRRVCGLGGRST